MHLRFSNEHWSGTPQFRSASRCYVEEAHSIIVTATYIDSASDISELSSKRLKLREQKWTTLHHQDIESELGGGSRQISPTTLIPSFSVITPEFVRPSLICVRCKEIVETAVITLWVSGVAVS